MKRHALGRTRPGAIFPVAPLKSVLPPNYPVLFAQLKQRIERERIKVALSANAAMVLLYWDIGQTILASQKKAQWGAKVIDRLAADLGYAFPDMRGFSPRNLKYMRAFAAAWPDRSIVQRTVAQIPWRQNIALLENLRDARTRLWYAQQTIQNGWSQPILKMQIDNKAHERAGKAATNFRATLPPTDSDGEKIVATLSAQLTKEYGSGFNRYALSRTNL